MKKERNRKKKLNIKKNIDEMLNQHEFLCLKHVIEQRFKKKEEKILGRNYFKFFILLKYIFTIKYIGV